MRLYDEPVDPFAAPQVVAAPKRSVYTPKPEYDDACGKLCDYMQRRVHRNLTPAQAARVKVDDKWLLAAEQLMRIDKYTPQEIARVIEWATQDAFWRANVRTMPALRKKFTQLCLHPRFEAWCKNTGRPLISPEAPVQVTGPVHEAARRNPAWGDSRAKTYTSQM